MMTLEEFLEQFKSPVKSPSDLFGQSLLIAPNGDFLFVDSQEQLAKALYLLGFEKQKGLLQSKLLYDLGYISADVHGYLCLTDVKPTLEQQKSLITLSIAMGGTTYISLPSGKLPSMMHAFNQTPENLLKFIMEQY